MQAIRAGLGPLGRVAAVEQVAVDVVLEDEAGRVEPVVEDLGAHDVAPHAPAVLVALVAQPVVAQDLGVEVVRLEGRVVHVALGPLEEEEAVVVHLLVAAVQPEEDCNVLVVVVVVELSESVSRIASIELNQELWSFYLAGIKVEVFGVELVAFLEIRHTHAVVTQFVHGCWALLKALELVGIAVLLLGLYHDGSAQLPHSSSAYHSGHNQNQPQQSP